MAKIIVITGQTATGKTSYALKLARRVGGELISADSRQIYKYLDIITGKDLPENSEFTIAETSGVTLDDSPSDGRTPGVTGTGSPGVKAEPTTVLGYYLIKGVKLWLYDALDPKIPSSSFLFKKLAAHVIRDTISRGSIPIVTGGTYLYIKHLLYGVDTETIPPNWNLRKKLACKTPSELFNMLCTINVQMSRHLNASDRKNTRRLIRKIEIAKTQSLPVKADSDGRTQELTGTGPHGVKKEPQYTIKQLIGLKFKLNKDLEQAIKNRVEKRLRAGAIEEIKSLVKHGYRKTDPGLQTIGYKQLIDYLEGKISKKQAIEQWITAEIQYARRQLTFMKKDKSISWKEI